MTKIITLLMKTHRRKVSYSNFLLLFETQVYLTVISVCNYFTDFDGNTVKKHNCTRQKCNFKCKRGYENLTAQTVTCVTNQYGASAWDNAETVRCHPIY